MAEKFNPKTGKIEAAVEIDLAEMLRFIKGEKGDVGPQGPKGEKGDKGDIGLRGQQGDPGKDGKDGKDGANGLMGQMGPRGFPGPSGLDGKDGLPGANGKDGWDSGTVFRTKMIPPELLGKNGDWAFNEAGEIFYRQNNKWEFYISFMQGGNVATNIQLPTSYSPRILFSVDATPDYSSGDQVDSRQEIVNCARSVSGGGILDSLTVVDRAAQQQNMIFSFFKDDPTSAADNNSALTITDADDANFLFSVLVPTGRYLTLSSGKLTATVPVGYRYTCANTSLWLVAEAYGTINFAASTDLAVTLGMLRD